MLRLQPDPAYHPSYRNQYAPATPQKNHKTARREMTKTHGSVTQAIQADRRNFDRFSEGSALSHTVKSGQTAGEIAKAHGVSLELLKAYNPQIQNINKIQVGQSLRLTPLPSQRGQDLTARATPKEQQKQLATEQRLTERYREEVRQARIAAGETLPPSSPQTVQATASPGKNPS